MEVRYKVMLYIAVALFAVLFILAFVPFGKGLKKYKKGKKAANVFYTQDTGFFRRKLAAYKVFTFFTVFFCCLSIVASTILLARPFRKETVVEEKYTRDIFLCIDISSSVDSLNAHLIKELKGIVDEMQGERFGLMIFNTSPVLLVPMTDDYTYIQERLDEIEDNLNERYENYDFYNYDDSYISTGTLVGSDVRGSSLIGDGLSATVFAFPDLEEDKERTRLIIFSTDNDLNGQPHISLDEAADLCVRNDVKVYGIGLADMNKHRRNEMRDAVEKTGGKFYEESVSGTHKSIINDIERETKSFIREEPVDKETEYVVIPFVIILSLVTVTTVFARLSKL